LSKPKRLFIVYISDPCIDIDLSSKTLLYALLVSHGIRVDTSLYIVSSRDTFYFNGYRLRHLYPQESSLHGFSKTVFCKKKKLSGVYYGYKLSPSKPLCLVKWGSRGYNVHRKPCIECSEIVIPVNLEDNTVNNIIGSDYRVLTIRAIPSDILYRINIAHYLLDTWFGALIRRKGVVVEYDGEI